MQIEEDLSRPNFEVDLAILVEHSLKRLSSNVDAVRSVYRRDYSEHTLIVRWLFGSASSRVYEVLVEISAPYTIGESLWPFTMEQEMNLLEESEDRWEVAGASVHRGKGKSLSNKVLLRRHPNRLSPYEIVR